MFALARKIVSGEEDADSVESVWEDPFTSRRSHRCRRCPYNRGSLQRLGEELSLPGPNAKWLCECTEELCGLRFT